MPTSPLYTTAPDPPGENLPEGWTYDAEEADKVVQFFSKLTHGQAEWAGEPFGMLPWEEDLCRRIYGTRNADGHRAYRIVTLIVPSGAGKTTWAAGVIIYELLNVGPQSELIGIAKDSKQASRVFNTLKGLLRQDFTLMSGFDIRKQPNRVIRVGTEATFQIASKDIGQLLGSIPSFSYLDELAVVPQENIEQILTMSAKQKDGWVLQTTTAGMGDTSRHSYAYQQWDLIRRIHEGVIENTDPSFLGVVYGADTDEDWSQLETAYKANPSLGITLEPKIIAEELERAKQSPALVPSYRCFRLNQWQSEVVGGLIDMPAWRKGGTKWKPEDLTGRDCWGALDVSSRIDLSAFVLVFEDEDKLKVVPFFYAPAEGIYERSITSNTPYNVWAEQQLLTLVPGPTIDQRFIKKHIMEQAGRFNIRDITFDPWSARQLATELEEEGLSMWEARQGFGTLSAPTKELQERVIQGTLDHGNNPILTAHAEATVAKVDENGNLRPDKKKSGIGGAKIDGIVALVMALDGHTRRGDSGEVDDDFEWV